MSDTPSNHADPDPSRTRTSLLLLLFSKVAMLVVAAAAVRAGADPWLIGIAALGFVAVSTPEVIRATRAVRA